MKSLHYRALFVTSVILSVLGVMGNGITAHASTNLNEYVIYSGANSNHEAGYSVVADGDINNDGYDDLLIGAPGAGLGGVTYLLYGQPDTLAGGLLTDATTFTAASSTDSAGTSVTILDLNGDGFDDLVFGAPGNGDVASNSGAVFIFYGSGEEMSSASMSSGIGLYGQEMNGHASFTVTSAGDINNDGYDDLAIGAYVLDGNGPDSGAVYIVYGQSSMFTDGTSLETFPRIDGEASGDQLGTSLSYVGDRNMDGFDDLLIGARHNDTGGSNAGAVYILHGQSTAFTSTTIDTIMSTRITGTAADENLGTSIGGGNDVDGDGFTDILIGSRYADTNGADSGAAYLFYGSSSAISSGTVNTAEAVFNGVEADNQAGVSVAVLNDLNGDDLADMMVSASNSDGNSTGSSYVIFGSASRYTGATTLDNAEIINLTTTNIGEDAGARVAFGDLNGDSFAEFILGAPGNDTNGEDAGAVYIGYAYIDNDGDGIPGTDGAFSGIDNNTATDCDDSNTAVSEEETYYGDTDGDGLGDANNSITVCSTTPPDNYVDNSTDEDDTRSDTLTITKVKGGKKGNIRVFYNDSSVVKYRIFPKFNGPKRTRVKQVSGTTYTVLHGKGKKLALVDVSNGTVFKKVRISRKGFKQVALKNLDVRNDGKVEAVVTLRNPKKDKIKVAMVRIKAGNTKLRKKDTVTITEGDRNVRVKKTIAKAKRLHLRNKKAKLAVKFKVTKRYKFKVLDIR